MDELIERMRAAYRVCRDADDYIQDAKEREKKLTDSIGWKKAIVVAACIFVAIIVFVKLLGNVTSSLEGASPIEVLQGIIQGEVSITTFLMMIIVPLLIAIVGSIVGVYVLGIVNDIYIDSIMDTAEEQANEVMAGSRGSIAFLPKEYRSAKATGFILSILEQGRASGLQEAFDKCDNYLYRAKVEELCDRIKELYSDM